MANVGIYTSPMDAMGIDHLHMLMMAIVKASEATPQRLGPSVFLRLLPGAVSGRERPWAL